jgi:alpha-1,3/alpha-1,6-mannosyltransferase
MRVALVHPDLGIGGAERLVIDIALALQRNGHSPVLYTAYRDASRCFADVKPSREQVPVQVVSPLFPRSILGRGHVRYKRFRSSTFMT